MSSIRGMQGIRHCDGCQATQTKLSCCARCKQAWYCSKDCQAKDWRQGHSRLCLPVTSATGPSVSTVKQVAAHVLLPKEPSSWRDVNLAQAVIDKIVSDFIDGLVQQIVEQLPPRVKTILPESLIRQIYTEKVVALAGTLINRLPCTAKDLNEQGEAAKHFAFLSSTIAQLIDKGDLREQCVPALTERLDNERKNIIFRLKSAKVAQKGSEDLQSFIAGKPSTSSLKRYFQHTLLPALQQARSQIAQENQDPKAGEFGQWRISMGGVYSTFTTPLDVEHAPYNKRIAALVQENRGRAATSSLYQEWTPDQMREQGFIGPVISSVDDICLKEEQGSPEVEEERARFPEKERIEIVLQAPFQDLQTASMRNRVSRCIALFPRTHTRMNILNVLHAIVENQSKRFEGPTKIDAFTITQREGQWSFPNIGSSPRNLARLELEDPSNKSIFWMMIPESGELALVYLQHSNICESTEIMDNVVDPLFLQIVQLPKSCGKRDLEFIEEVKSLVGRLVYAFAQASPYARGSAAIAEQCEAICYKFHGLEYTHLPKADCEALTLSEKDFLQLYSSSVQVRSAQQGASVLSS